MKNTEEEEQYMTIGEDGRPYIAIRRKGKRTSRKKLIQRFPTDKKRKTGSKRKNNI